MHNPDVWSSLRTGLMPTDGDALVAMVALYTYRWLGERDQNSPRTFRASDLAKLLGVACDDVANDLTLIFVPNNGRCINLVLAPDAAESPQKALHGAAAVAGETGPWKAADVAAVLGTPPPSWLQANADIMIRKSERHLRYIVLPDPAGLVRDHFLQQSDEPRLEMCFLSIRICGGGGDVEFTCTRTRVNNSEVVIQGQDADLCPGPRPGRGGGTTGGGTIPGKGLPGGEEECVVSSDWLGQSARGPLDTASSRDEWFWTSR